MMIWSALLLILLILAPGYGAWLAFSDDEQQRKSALETLFVLSLAGLLTATLAAFILAEFGWFKLTTLAIVLAVFTAVTSGWGLIKRGRGWNPLSETHFHLFDVVPFLLLAAAFLMVRDNFEYIVGGRDHGVYFNTAVHIAKNGSILITDQELAAVPPESRGLLVNPEVSLNQPGLPGPWSQGQRLPGLTIRDLDKGTIIPHAFHLYPALIAIFYAAGGLSFGLGTTIVLAMFGSMAFYLAGRRLFGPTTAALALFFVVINVSQMWFTRYPAAENFTRLLFWSGLFTIGLMIRSQSRSLAVLAGLCFGLMHLAKLDTLIVMVILGLFFVYLWIRQRWQPQYSYFAGTYLLLTFMALLHGYFIATTYFIDQAVRELLPSFLADRLAAAADGRPYPLDSLANLLSSSAILIALAVIAVGILIFLIIKYRELIDRSLSKVEWLGPWIRELLVGVLALLTLYALIAPEIITIDLLDKSQSAFTSLSWYLTSLGLVLGVVGLSMFVLSSSRSDQVLTWMLIIGSALPLLIAGSFTSADHFWAIRRFVPVIIPALLLFAAKLLVDLFLKSRKKWIRLAIPVILGLLLAVGMLKDTSKLYGFVEYRGIAQELEEISSGFEPDSVLLIERSDAGNRLALPLWQIWEQTVFSVSPNSAMDPAFGLAVDSWLTQDRDVFWLSVGDIDPDLFSDHYVNYIDAVNVVVPLIERSKIRIPAESGQKVMHFNVYEVQDRPFENPVFASSLDAGVEELDDSIEGLYAAEIVSGLTRRRWSSDLITLSFPDEGQPVELQLLLSNSRPDGAPPAEAAVHLGDEMLDSFTVNSDPLLYRIDLPEDLEVEGSDIIFTIEVAPWIPSETSGSEDDRPLGIIFYRADLISRAKSID